MRYLDAVKVTIGSLGAGSFGSGAGLVILPFPPLLPFGAERYPLPGAVITISLISNPPLVGPCLPESFSPVYGCVLVISAPPEPFPQLSIN